MKGADVIYHPNRELEDICYEPKHLELVRKEIQKNFGNYFLDFLETQAGKAISAAKAAEIAKALGATTRLRTPAGSKQKEAFLNIIQHAIAEFEKDREKYAELMDLEALEEYADDPSNFKNTVLKNQCPIIHSTLHNKKAKELDKYRMEFNKADPGDLLIVVKNLAAFAICYSEDNYDPEIYDELTSLEELALSDLDKDENYTVYGVIGGGIKSHLLYKMNPEVFPNRSRAALWALYYLTDKKTFDCHQDSEFLMIHADKGTTQQNYFYPYELFSIYALHIFQLLNVEANRIGVELDSNYRYVFVDAFLSFVAESHAAEIDFLKSASGEVEYAYH